MNYTTTDMNVPADAVRPLSRELFALTPPLTPQTLGYPQRRTPELRRGPHCRVRTLRQICQPSS